MIRRLIAIAATAALAGPGLAQTDARAGPSADALSGVLAGIVHYTRWPDTPAVLRVCVDSHDELAGSAGARRLGDAFALLSPRTIVVEGRRLEAGAATLADCQALYVGDAAVGTWQRLLKELVNQPVLTIGFGEEFCSRGGLFCLERADTELRIHANLDAISRSGLRVNPQLLRMTQRGDAKAGR